MALLPLVERLKYNAIRNPLVNMSSFGDIQLYNNKSTIKYPYVNWDVINSDVDKYIKTYTIRIYVCDRNLTPYNAYNKCETILDDLLQELEIEKYGVQYFTLNYGDQVDGCYSDFQIEVPMSGNCVYQSLFSHILLEEGSFQLLESGDLIIIG